MDKIGARRLWTLWIVTVWFLGSPVLLAQSNDIDAFYEARSDAPAWSGGASHSALPSLVSAIENAKTHGLDPSDYGLEVLLGLEPYPVGITPDQFVTRAYFDLARDLLQGRVRLDHDVRWPFTPSHVDLPAHLANALESGDIVESLEALAPSHREYQRLREALVEYQSLAAPGYGPVFETTKTLHPGDIDPDIARLRARLEAMGEIERIELPETASALESSDIPQVNVYDDELEAVVRRIQGHAHLEDDGVVGAETRAWINVSIERRVDELRTNLERWRWMPRDLGLHHILVNLPDYRLQIFENYEPVGRHDVIIGRPSRRSPILSATITHVVANPWWETPHSLAVRDELPLFQRDPGAVSRLGFQVIDRESGEVVDASQIDWSTVSASNFPYRLRQAPGPLNALGQVKLIFPNPYNTYLHDTPSRSLFERHARAFSSGCVRVQNPVDLAEWVIRVGTDLDDGAVRLAIETGRETRIDLPDAVEVHFLYLTAFSDDVGRVRFVPDVYNRDDAVIAALSDSSTLGGLRHEEHNNQLAMSVIDGCGVSF